MCHVSERFPRLAVRGLCDYSGAVRVSTLLGSVPESVCKNTKIDRRFNC